MAFKCGLFDSKSVVETVDGFPRGDKAQSAEFFAKYFASFVGNGVHPKPADAFAICTDYGTTVEIRPGRAFINGYFCYDDASGMESFPKSSSEQKYVFVLRLQVEEGDIVQMWVKDPAPDSLPLRSAKYYDLVIATVTIPAGATNITEDMIEDHRGDASLCGYVSSII